MKHLFTTIILLTSTIIAKGNSLDTTPILETAKLDTTAKTNNYMYAELLGTGKLFSNKVTVEIDFGQETKFFNKDSNRIVDPETGKPIQFNSMVDAMNYMGVLGWEFIQAYVVTTSGQNVYHWLLKKKIQDSDLSDDLPTIRRNLKK